MRALLARLRGRSTQPEPTPAATHAESGAGTAESEQPAPAAIDEPRPESRAEAQSRPAPAVEPDGEDVPASPAPGQIDESPREDHAVTAGQAAPDAMRGLAGPAARPLPSFRPVPGGRSAVAEPEAEPLPELSLTLSEAIDLVHEAGGDTMELRFLRRELQRKGGDGNERPELWGRIEQAVTGRLRRAGRLAEGQPLALRRDS
jgi:hypothetical protein